MSSVLNEFFPLSGNDQSDLKFVWADKWTVQRWEHDKGLQCKCTMSWMFLRI